MRAHPRRQRSGKLTSGAGDDRRGHSHNRASPADTSPRAARGRSGASVTGLWVAGSAAAGFASGPALRAVIFYFGTPSGDPPRRVCPACGHAVFTIGPLLWPYLPLTGRCPACATRIGPPLVSVELLTAAALAIVAARATTAWELAALGWLAIVAVPLAFIDVAVRRLPNQLTAAAYAGTLALLGAAALAGHHPGQLGRAALAGAALCGAYLVMLAAFPRGIGGGDAKIAAGVGTALGWLGWPLLLTGAVACFAACTLCSAFLLASRRVKLTGHVPLGPFILLGALVAIAVQPAAAAAQPAAHACYLRANVQETQR